MRLIFFVIMLCLGLFGCGTTSLNKCIDNSISEIREFVLVGENENMSISLMCGSREMDYKMDGYHTSPIEFGVITLTLLDGDGDIENASYTLFSGTNKYEGFLVKNPFDGSYVADIKVMTEKNANTSIVVTLDDNAYSLKLKNIDGEWKVSIREVLKIFVKQHRAQISSLCVDGELAGEVYVKIMNDEMGLSNDYYYLICVVGRKGESIRVIYSPFSGDILASTSNI